MGMFDNIESVSANQSNGGRYDVAGHYLMRIDRVKAGVSKQDSSEFVAIEKTVIFTFPDGELPVDNQWNKLSTDAWHSPGEQVSHLMQAKHASFKANYKAFVANVGGMPESTVTAEQCRLVTEGLFEGLFVEVRSRTIKTRKGTPFTAVTYLREVMPSEVKARVPAEILDRVLGVGVIDEIIEATQES